MEPPLQSLQGVTRSFVTVPLTRSCIWMPTWSRRAALAGLALRAPCRPAMVGVHAMSWALVALFGPRLFGRGQLQWTPRLPRQDWEALCRQWRDALGRFDGMAVFERPQASREGLSVLLLRDDRPLAFVKVHDQSGAPALRTSSRVLAAFERHPASTFRVPRPLASGCAGCWTWMALSPIPPRPHRPPARPPLEVIVSEIQDRLASVLSRDAIPHHWLPMHGDLTPWNVRRVGLRSLWLLDWDDAGWGPPGADRVFYAANAALVLGESSSVAPDEREAVRFWRERVGAHSPGDFDSPHNIALGQRLAAMEQAGS